MTNETAEKKVLHPEGKILLKNGNILECYPLSCVPDVIASDELEIDRTGTYLIVGDGYPKNVTSSVNDKEEDWEKLFLREALFLYEHKDEIFSDSRMFLTPLPFKNNLAYSGTSGMRDATLGVYLEWWEECERAVIRHDGEVYALTYFIAGSPLSGRNHCCAVTGDGNSFGFSFGSPFSEIWRSFMEINGRYTSAKQLYRAYSLNETVSKLRLGE